MLELIERWGWLVSMAITGLGLWVGWSVSRYFVVKGECEQRISNIAEQRRNTDRRLWEAVDGLKAEQHNQAVNMEEIRGDLRAIRAEVAGTREIVTRLENNVNIILRAHLRGEPV